MVMFSYLTLEDKDLCQLAGETEGSRQLSQSWHRYTVVALSLQAWSLWVTSVVALSLQAWGRWVTT